MSWTNDNGVAMPVDATEYQEFLNAAGLSVQVPDSLFLCNEPSGSLADSIGARTLVKTGPGVFAYQTTVPGWDAVGVQVPMGSSSDWFSFAGNNLLTTPVAALLVTDLRTLGASRMLLSLGGSSTANATEVYHDSTGAIVARRAGNVATSTAHPDDVVLVLMVMRAGSSDFSVYVRTKVSGLETLTPTFTNPPNAAQTVFLSSGWNFAASDAAQMRVEYWTGAKADAFNAITAAAFLEARLNPPTPTPAPNGPVSLGGLMTVLLLAQPASRRQRQLVYGKGIRIPRKR